jgi:hypothetical protein
MTTAQKIIAANSATTFSQAQALEAAARELATKTTGANCYNRTWTFYDGSNITKTRDGYTAGSAK